MTRFYSWLTRLAVDAPRRVLAVWAIVLGLGAITAAGVHGALTVGGFSLPGTEFHAASLALSRELGVSPEKSALIVFHSDELYISDLRFHDAVETALTALTRDPVVMRVESFYSTGLPDVVSASNHTTYALATLDGTDTELEEATPRLREAVRSSDLQALLIGQSEANFDIESASATDLARVELFTFPLVFVLLVLAFGSLIAAGIPLISGLVGVVGTLAALSILSRLTDVSIFALNTASMIGLGLAIDFSLIMVTRFREELARQPLERALEVTLQTAGRSITYSGLTLMLAMAALSLFPVMVIRSIAVSIAMSAALAVLTGLFLLPTILVVTGRHINRLDPRRHLPWRPGLMGGVWRRWCFTVMRRPWFSLFVAFAILGVAMLPAFHLQRSGVTVSVLPESSESRRGVALLRDQFGPGEAAPLFVIVQSPAPGGLWQPDLLQGIFDLQHHLTTDPRVAHVQSLASLIPNPSPEWMRSLSPATIATSPDRERLAKRLANLSGANTSTMLVVYPRTIETDQQTVQLLLDVRANATTWAPGLAGARVLVGGVPAQHYDFDKVVYDLFPLWLAVGLLITGASLVLVFRSVLLPVKALILNLASLLASLGILVVVFQWGVGDSLLGFRSLGAILSYTPVLLFAILFGLSTDYEVFVLMRIREYVSQGYANEDAVALGVERTAGVITAAGAVMIVVFGSFALAQVLVIKELGFGLAVAVLLDVTLVRLVLLPASLKLMGALNWWLPPILGKQFTKGVLNADQA
jgi:putative drug exporter of the RND superfamily